MAQLLWSDKLEQDLQRAQLRKKPIAGAWPLTRKTVEETAEEVTLPEEGPTEFSTVWTWSLSRPRSIQELEFKRDDLSPQLKLDKPTQPFTLAKADKPKKDLFTEADLPLVRQLLDEWFSIEEIKEGKRESVKLKVPERLDAKGMQKPTTPAVPEAEKPGVLWRAKEAAITWLLWPLDPIRQLATKWEVTPAKEFWETVSNIVKKMKFQSEADDRAFTSGLKFLGNLPQNTAQIWGDILTLVSDPVWTWKSIKDLAQAWVETWLNKVFSTEAAQNALRSVWVDEWKLAWLREEWYFTKPELREISRVVGEEIDKLWEEWRVKELLVENPADVLLTLVGWIGVAKNVAKSKNLTDLANKLDNIEKVVNPINIQAKAIQGTRTWVARAKGKLFPEKSLDDLIKQASQGWDKNIKSFQDSLEKIDTREIKTYKELSDSFSQKISELSKEQNKILPDEANLKIDDLTTTKGERTTNFVKNALDDIENVWNKETDLDLLNFVDEFRAKENLSIKDINDLAKFYGSQFKDKSFFKTWAKAWEQKSSVSAARFENTRKWLKDKSRDLLPDDTSKILDREMSKLFESRDLADDMANKVSNLQKKITDRGLLENVARSIWRAVDVASLWTIRGFFTSFLPSNIWNKVMNSIAIQESLAKNLKKIEQLTKWAEKLDDADLVKKYSDIIKDIAWNNALSIEAWTLTQRWE